MNWLDFLKDLGIEMLDLVGLEWAEINGPLKIVGAVVGLIVVALILWRFRDKRWLRWVLFAAGTVGMIAAIWMLFGKTIWLVPIAILFTGGGFLALFWFFLAPNNMFFTFVNEGTAKIVVRGGQVKKVLIQFKNHTVDQNWNVIPGQERHLLGGFRWIGIWPLNEMYVYQFKWTNVLHDGTVQQHPMSGEPVEWLDYILVKQDVYYFAETSTEDADLLPLKVEVLLTIRVVNPYKALFAVQGWLETIINRYRPAVRDRVAQDRYKTLISQKGSMASELFASSAALRREFLDQYGVQIIAVEVKDIEPPEEQRAETLRRWTAEREAERVGVEAAAEAARRRTIADGEADRIDREYEAVRRQGWRGLVIRLLEGKYGRV